MLRVQLPCGWISPQESKEPRLELMMGLAAELAAKKLTLKAVVDPVLVILNALGFPVKVACVESLTERASVFEGRLVDRVVFGMVGVDEGSVLGL